MSRTIVLTGGPGAGKTTVATVLAERSGMSRLDVAQVLSDALPPEIHVTSRAEIGPRFLDVRGVDGVAHAILAAQPAEDVVIDAIRFARSCRQLQSWRPNAEFWHVDAQPAERRRRVRRRLSHLSPPQRARQLREYFRFENELPALRAGATMILTNERGRASLEDQVLAALETGARRASA